MPDKRKRVYARIDDDEKARLNLQLLPERDNVQVYKDTFDLLVFVYRTTTAMNRDYRYTLAEGMKRTLQQLLTSIYEAKKTTPKTALLIEALHWVYEAKVLYRVMDELSLLKGWQCAVYIQQLSTISKQLVAWHRYESKKEAPADGY